MWNRRANWRALSTFRVSFARGWAGIESSLREEVNKALKEGWAELRSIVEDVFDGSGSASEVGGYASRDWDLVQIAGLEDPFKGTSGEPAEVVYDIVHDYLGHREPLGDDWWVECLEHHRGYPTVLHLIVTERPVAFSAPPLTTESASVGAYDATDFNGPVLVVVADVGGSSNAEAKRGVIQSAKKELVRLLRQRTK
jgi:hypothetical protein